MFISGYTSHNKRLSEMAVGAETDVLLFLRPLVVFWGAAPPVRHFAKPPSVKQNPLRGFCLTAWRASLSVALGRFADFA